MMQICGEMQELDSQGTLSLQQLAGEPSAVGGTAEVFGKEDSGWATARRDVGIRSVGIYSGCTAVFPD